MDQQLLLSVMLTVVTLVLSITVHEYAHALAAYKLGDDYAAGQGRLTLNPIAHADPMGTLLFPIVFTVMNVGIFGWGRPVPYIPTNLSRRFSMRAGEAIVAFAGPFANLIMAIVCGGLWVGLVAYRVIDGNSAFFLLLDRMLVLNAVLFFFNLLPVPPLDGSKIIAFVLGQRIDGVLDAIQSAGPIGLLVVVMAGGAVISWPVGLLVHAILQGFQAFFI